MSLTSSIATIWSNFCNSCMASLSAEKMGLFQSWASSWWTVFRGKPYPCPLQSLMGQFVIRYDLHIPHTLLLHKQKELQKNKSYFSSLPVRPPLLRAPRAAGSFYRLFILEPVGNVFTSSSTLFNSHLSAYWFRWTIRLLGFKHIFRQTGSLGWLQAAYIVTLDDQLCVCTPTIGQWRVELYPQVLPSKHLSKNLWSIKEFKVLVSCLHLHDGVPLFRVFGMSNGQPITR